jgi:hypothetical protein
MKSIAAYWALFGKEFFYTKCTFTRRASGQSHGTTQVMRIHVVEVVLADIRMVLKLMRAAALA